jgi:apolipoprotein N-acyltransferase
MNYNSTKQQDESTPQPLIDDDASPYDADEFDTKYCKGQLGYMLLFLSAVCLGFGNSLESISILSFLSVFLFIIALQRIIRVDDTILPYRCCMKSSTFLLVFFIFSQGAAYCFGFSGVFGFPHTTFFTVFESFVAGVLYCTIYALFAVIPHMVIMHRNSNSFHLTSWSNLIVFPVCHTCCTCTIVGTYFSTFTSIGNSVLDYELMRQFAFFFGIVGIHCFLLFLGTWTGLLFDYFFMSSKHTALRPQHTLRKFVTPVAVGILVVLIVNGFVFRRESFYQVPNEDLITPTVSVSCIFSEAAKENTDKWNDVWNNTRTRLLAGDVIVLQSEEAFLIESDEKEQEVLDYAQQLVYNSYVERYGSSSSSKHTKEIFLGVSYEKMKKGESMGTNQFALFSSKKGLNGDPVWNYKKAHPVPLVESEIKPGAWELPTYTSSSSLGKLSGSICFDMDFPPLIQQAGFQKVDIMLQPSWTWNAISYRHFDGDAIRAIENGFTLFRCSSQGVSGVVSPTGDVMTKAYTGEDPNKLAIFTLPIMKRSETFYSLIGFAFEWLVLALTIVFLCYTYFPHVVLNMMYYGSSSGTLTSFGKFATACGFPYNGPY